MKDLLELTNRKKIHKAIMKNPGIHLSKIADILKMRISLVEYHLIYLEKNNVIQAVKESGYTRYYPTESFGQEDKKLLSILRQEIPLKIVLFLVKYEYSYHKEILENLDIAASTLSYHIKKLIDKGIVVNNNGKYYIENKQKIIGIISQYKPYDLYDGFSDVWSDFLV